jgi:hypothetical protein
MATIHRRTSKHQPADVLVVFGISGDPMTFQHARDAIGQARMPGSRGPDEANELVAPYGGWHDPGVTS